jgi:hypothetical protein
MSEKRSSSRQEETTRCLLPVNHPLSNLPVKRYLVSAPRFQSIVVNGKAIGSHPSCPPCLRLWYKRVECGTGRSLAATPPAYPGTREPPHSRPQGTSSIHEIASVGKRRKQNCTAIEKSTAVPGVEVRSNVRAPRSSELGGRQGRTQQPWQDCTSIRIRSGQPHPGAETLYRVVSPRLCERRRDRKPDLGFNTSLTSV